MADSTELTEGPNSDLDRTDALPVLDLAAYEAKIERSGAELAVHASVESDAPSERDRTERRAAHSPDRSASGIQHSTTAQIAHGGGTGHTAARRPDSPAAVAARVDQVEAELKRLGAALRAELDRARREFEGRLDERAARIALLGTELDAVGARVAETESGLATCAESVARLVAAAHHRELATAAPARTVDDLRAESGGRSADRGRLAAAGRRQDGNGASLAPALTAEAQPSHATLQLPDVRLDANSREGAGQEARVRDADEAQDAPLKAAANRAAALQSADVTLAEHAARLEASSDRLSSLEHGARIQATRFARLETELAAAKSLAEQGDAQRRALESALDRVASECALQERRAAEIELRHADLSMELEATRRALAERNLQVRRLDRQRTIRAQGAAAAGRRAAGPVRPSNDASAGATDALATLVAIGGSGEIRFALNGRTTIGRARDNNLCLREASISRHHAVVMIGSNGAFIEDLETVNGVAVNGRRVRHAWLGDGDIITLGVRRFLFTTVAATKDEPG